MSVFAAIVAAASLITFIVLGWGVAAIVAAFVLIAVAAIASL